MKRVIDITGQKFGKLLVLSYSHTTKDSMSHWNCTCDCGNKCIKRLGNLKYGHTKSCGCLSLERTDEWKEKITQSNRGKKRSLEIRMQMSLSRKGRVSNRKGCKLSDETKAKLSESHKREKHPLWGKHHSEEARHKIGDANRGENNGMWRGGTAYSPCYLGFTRTLREKIRDRDGRICQICKMTEEDNGRKLAVHHVDYNKENSNPENLISLCQRCHANTTNKTRLLWECLISTVQKERYGARTN